VQAQAAPQDIELGAVAGDEWDGLPFRVDMDERGEVYTAQHIHTYT
jgi:hypothetical protein